MTMVMIHDAFDSFDDEFDGWTIGGDLRLAL